MKGKSCAFILFFVVLCYALSVPVAADGGENDITEAGAQITEEWQGVANALPDEIRDLLPDSFFSEDIGQVAEGTKEAGTLREILRIVGKLTGVAIRENLGLLAIICGILVLSATFRAAFPSQKGGVGTALAFCSALSMVLLLFSICHTQFEAIKGYFNTIGTLCTSFIPLMGALYAMGGNIGAAVANHGIMSAFLVVLETVCAKTVIPVAGICLVFALIETTGAHVSLRSLSGLIKRTYTVGISFLMLLLGGMLGLQTTLAKGADTLALRTVRFAAGSFLPVVGGSVSESLKTVAGSVDYLRGMCGTGGILILLFAFLPMFLSVFFARLTFMLGGAAASMLGCGKEERLLAEFASVWGYFLAIIASLFVMIVFSLSLLSHCAAAIG